MYDEENRRNCKILLFALYTILCIACGAWLFRSCGRTNAPAELPAAASTNGTVGQIGGYTAATGATVSDSAHHVGEAGEAADKAAAAIRDSRETAGSVQAGTKNCKELLDDCERLNREAAELVRTIREGYSGGEGRR